jgi:hypothetical protein
MLRPSVAAICFLLGLALLMGTPAKGNAAGFSNRDFDGGYSCTVRGLISNPLTDLTPSGCVLQIQPLGNGRFGEGELTTHVGRRVCRYVLVANGSSYSINPNGTGSIIFMFNLVDEAQPAECPGVLAHLDLVLFGGGDGLNMVATDLPNVYTGTCTKQ